MVTLVKALVGLSALALVLAVVTTLMESVLFTSPEGYSRASANLALLAIALVLGFRTGRPAALP